MLVSEVRGGKSLKSAKNQEDYLTSAVFGHLRYLPPKCFWPALLQRAESCGGDGNLYDYLIENKIRVARYESLDVDFWPWKGKRVGRPDLIMKFTAKDVRTLRIVTEVKLRSRKGKKGRGRRRDQLADYFQLLRTREMLSTFIYLTPRDDWCQEDLDDTFARRPGLEKYRSQVFRLHWYDLAIAAKAEQKKARHPYDMILGDISKFLHRRELDHAIGRKTVRTLAATQRDTSETAEDSELAFVINVMSW